VTRPADETLEREKRLFTMDEAAVEMRVSRRWLQDFIQDHPYYRLVGRKKLFEPEHINRLIGAMPCPGSSSRPAKAKRCSGTSGANTSESDWTTARELLTSERPSASSRHGENKPNVVSFSAPTSRSRPPS